MNLQRFARILAVVSLAMATVAGSAAYAGKITVHFSGIEDFEGEVLISLASSPEMFDSDAEAAFSASVPARAKRATAVFESVPAGDYAIKVFHDANSNKKLDMGLMGPKEKYGFSNNVMGFMGPPDFDDAKVTFDGSELVVEIEAR